MMASARLFPVLLSLLCFSAATQAQTAATRSTPPVSYKLIAVK
jgi:hypothetical protein